MATGRQVLPLALGLPVDGNAMLGNAREGGRRDAFILETGALVYGGRVSRPRLRRCTAFTWSQGEGEVCGGWRAEGRSGWLRAIWYDQPM